jgi:hypothetical protein
MARVALPCESSHRRVFLFSAGSTPGSPRADRAHFNQADLPLSQLAIEFYQPIPGGIDAGGRFAPEAVTVSKLRVYTPERKRRRVPMLTRPGDCR